MGGTNIPCDYLSNPQVQPGDQSLWANSNTSGLPLCPPVDAREMSIEVLHLAEGVLCLHTARDPSEEGPLPGMITGAHIAVFPHGLLDAEILLGVRTREGLICFRPVHSMGHFVVLPHTLPTCVLLPTIRTLDGFPLDAGRLVSPQHAP